MHKCLSQHSKFWDTELAYFSKIPDTIIFKRVGSREANKVGHIRIDLFSVSDKAKWLQTCFLFGKADNGELFKIMIKVRRKKASRSQFEGNPTFLFSHVICCSLSRKPYGKCLLKPRQSTG